MPEMSTRDISIKICGMRDPENIAALATLKPEFMGFIFYTQSPRCVTDDTRVFLAEDGLPDIQKVGVFVNAPESEVIHAAENYHLDYVQLHGVESPGYCHYLRQAGLRIIKAFGLASGFDFSMLTAYSEADYFLFDNATPKYGGSGNTFNWELLTQYTGNTPFFLSGGISADHIQKIKSAGPPIPYAVDINSRFEAMPGIKDIVRIGQFIQNLRS